MNPPRLSGVFRAALVQAAALLLIASSMATAAPQWVRATPFGGQIVDLEQAPSAPGMLYAVSSDGRLFRSLDGGATWNRRGKGPEGNFLGDVFVDPHVANTLYARGAAYLLFYRSRDAGLTWTLISSDTESFNALAADRTQPGVLYAGGFGGVYRSNDGGDSWLRIGLQGSSVSALEFDPRAAGTLFAVTAATEAEPALVWKSLDRGTTWTSSALPPTVPGMPHFVFDPVRPESLYFVIFDGSISFGGDILRSVDGGASWSRLPVNGFRDLAVAPDGTLLGAAEYGLERSSDGGTSWDPPIDPDALPPGGPPHDALYRVLVPSTAPGELLAAGSSGIWKSVDNGASWALSNQGILAQGAFDVAVPPTGPATVYTVAGVGLFRSTDRGESWTRLHSSFEGPQPYSIEAFDPRDPETLYGIDTDGQAAFPVVSTDGGRVWSKLSIPYECDDAGSICDVYLWRVALDFDGSILVYGSYYFHYQGGGSFLLRSTDGGQTWKKLRKPSSAITDLAVDPERSGNYHVVACNGLFQSTNAGASWTKTGRGLPGKLCFSVSPVLAVDPGDSRRIYVAVKGQGVFASSDGGATFRAMSRGLGDVTVVSLEIDPTDSSKLYAGVAEKGVFGWDEAKRRWTPLSKGLPLAYFTGEIALDPRQPSTLYAASPQQGVFRLELEEVTP